MTMSRPPYEDAASPERPAPTGDARSDGLLPDDGLPGDGVRADVRPAEAVSVTALDTSEAAPPPADGDAAAGRERSGDLSPVGRLAATVERLRREVRAAQAEAEGRALVELAKGVLVERLGCGPAAAARHLTELAEQAGVTPLELAVDVINQSAQDRLSEVTLGFLDTVAGRAGPRRTPRRPYGCAPRRAGRWRRRTPRPSPTRCSSTRSAPSVPWPWRSGRRDPTAP